MSKIKRGLKNFSYLTIGTIISQAIGFIGFIYLARYLGPEYYGIYVTIGAFAGLFKLLTFTGLKKVLIRKCSKDIENADEILNKTIGLQSLFVFIAISSMLVASLFTNYATTTKLFIAIFSLKLFSNSFRGYVNTIYKFSEKMQYLAIFQIIRNVLFVGLSILFLLLGYGLFTIVIISVGTSLLDFLLRFYRSRKIVKFDIFSKLDFDKSVIKPSIVFSAIGIVGRLHKRVDLVMISFLGTAPQVAIYGVAYTLAREANILKNLIGEAFFPIAVKTLHDGTIRKKFVMKYSLLFALSAFILGIIGFFLAEPAVDFFFGDEYTESGNILRVLIFYMVAWFSTLPFTEAVQATGNERVVLIGKGIMASINIPLNVVLYSIYGLIGIAYSTLVVYTVGSLIINFYSYYLLKKQGYIK